ncbi:MAG: hypothetical protein JXJ04_05905 [Spirochaetales bacterium]|nr:hypothetical protein [Spirochaetales bacterium]
MCPDHEILSAFFDGEVLSPWNKQLEKHISTCESCKQKIESYKKVRETLKNDPGPDPSLPMERVWNKISQLEIKIRPMQKPFWEKKVSLPIPLLAVAATIIICIGFISVFNVMKPHTSTVNIVTHKDDGSMTEVNIVAKDAEEIEALLKALENNSASNETIIRLPEGQNEFHVGEPELIRAVEFKRNNYK